MDAKVVAYLQAVHAEAVRRDPHIAEVERQIAQLRSAGGAGNAGQIDQLQKQADFLVKYALASAQEKIQLDAFLKAVAGQAAVAPHAAVTPGAATASKPAAGLAAKPQPKPVSKPAAVARPVARPKPTAKPKLDLAALHAEAVRRDPRIARDEQAIADIKSGKYGSTQDWLLPGLEKERDFYIQYALATPQQRLQIDAFLRNSAAQQDLQRRLSARDLPPAPAGTAKLVDNSWKNGQRRQFEWLDAAGRKLQGYATTMSTRKDGNATITEVREYFSHYVNGKLASTDMAVTTNETHPVNPRYGIANAHVTVFGRHQEYNDTGVEVRRTEQTTSRQTFESGKIVVENRTKSWGDGVNLVQGWTPARETYHRQDTDVWRADRNHVKVEVTSYASSGTTGHDSWAPAARVSHTIDSGGHAGDYLVQKSDPWANPMNSSGDGRWQTLATPRDDAAFKRWVGAPGNEIGTIDTTSASIINNGLQAGGVGWRALPIIGHALNALSIGTDIYHLASGKKFDAADLAGDVLMAIPLPWTFAAGIFVKFGLNSSEEAG